MNCNNFTIASTPVAKTPEEKAVCYEASQILASWNVANLRFKRVAAAMRRREIAKHLKDIQREEGDQ